MSRGAAWTGPWSCCGATTARARATRRTRRRSSSTRATTRRSTGAAWPRPTRQADRPLSLYVHLPFCAERCTFCGCNVVITRKREVSPRLPRLPAPRDRPAGGAPARPAPRDSVPLGRRDADLPDAWPRCARCTRSITSHFRLEPDAEVALEVDPRVTTREQMEALRDMGFNRLSMGVQDFTPEVQAAVEPEPDGGADARPLRDGARAGLPLRSTWT